MVNTLNIIAYIILIGLGLYSFYWLSKESKEQSVFFDESFVVILFISLMFAIVISDIVLFSYCFIKAILN